MRYVIWRDAEVAELADAHGSGPCDSNIMRVQVPSSARRLKSKGLSLFCLVESSDGTSHHQFARSVQYASRSSLPSVPFTAIPSPIKFQTWIVASGKPFESCKHSHRQPSAASASSPLTHSAGKTPGMDRPVPWIRLSLSLQKSISESYKHPHHQPSAASASSPPTHSAGEAPGMDRLIPGAGFLLARRRMRWRAADTPQTQKTFPTDHSIRKVFSYLTDN